MAALDEWFAAEFAVRMHRDDGSYVWERKHPVIQNHADECRKELVTQIGFLRAGPTQS